MQLSDLLSGGKNQVEIIPPDLELAKANSEYFQAGENTAFGMLITQSGGVIVEGAVRLLGSTADPNFRDINKVNAEYGNDEENYIILGDDIFGGIFALNLGFLPECSGNVIYFAPDTLEFEDLEIKLSQFFEFLRNRDLKDFYGQFSAEEYELLRAKKVGFNEFLHFYPPQFSAEFKTQKHDVRVIDIRECYKAAFNG